MPFDFEKRKDKELTDVRTIYKELKRREDIISQFYLRSSISKGQAKVKDLKKYLEQRKKLENINDVILFGQNKNPYKVEPNEERRLPNILPESKQTILTDPKSSKIASQKEFNKIFEKYEIPDDPHSIEIPAEIQNILNPKRKTSGSHKYTGLAKDLEKELNKKMANDGHQIDSVRISIASPPKMGKSSNGSGWGSGSLNASINLGRTHKAGNPPKTQMSQFSIPKDPNSKNLQNPQKVQNHRQIPRSRSQLRSKASQNSLHKILPVPSQSRQNPSIQPGASRPPIKRLKARKKTKMVKKGSRANSTTWVKEIRAQMNEIKNLNRLLKNEEGLQGSKFSKTMLKKKIPQSSSSGSILIHPIKRNANNWSKKKLRNDAQTLSTQSFSRQIREISHSGNDL